MQYVVQRLACQFLAISTVPLAAGNLDVECRTGGITVRSQMGVESVRLSVLNPDRPVRPDDVSQVREPERLVIRCSPSDKSSVGLELVVPHTTRLTARTRDGALRLEGIVERAELRTDSGPVHVALPWRISTVFVRSHVAPKRKSLPEVPGMKFVEGIALYDSIGSEVGLPKMWALGLYSDRSPLSRSIGTRAKQKTAPVLLPGVPPGLSGKYTDVWITAKKLPVLELINSPVPDGSWIRDPQQASEVLSSLTPGETRVTSQVLPAEPPPDNSTFRSEVRLVTLSFPAWDEHGRPVPGLRASDFEIEEDGVAQKVRFAGNDDQEPFDLAVVLDLGGRVVFPNVDVIKPAVRAFLEGTRPQDRIAIYALARGVFQVLTPLTSDRAALLRAVDAIPLVFMRSVLYDAVTLAYAQENLHRSRRRTAMVVLTNGSDLQHWRPTAREEKMLKSGRISVHEASSVRFDDLLRIASKLPVVLYPIVLPMINPISEEEAADGLTRMEQLASATGGRMFQAHKPDDLPAICRDAAAALRTVYGVSYYPKHADSDGRWRHVTIRVNRPGVVARARSGYHAW